MRVSLRVVSIVIFLMGAVWFLQGVNVIPGSFMTGEMEWAAYGGLAMAAGIALFVIAGRRSKS